MQTSIVRNDGSVDVSLREIPVTSTVNSTYVPSTISFFVLRQVDSIDDWKIQVLFDDGFKCDLTPIIAFPRTVSRFKQRKTQHCLSRSNFFFLVLHMVHMECVT